jgi:hypothetical protein
MKTPRSKPKASQGKTKKKTETTVKIKIKPISVKSRGKRPTMGKIKPKSLAPNNKTTSTTDVHTGGSIETLQTPTKKDAGLLVDFDAKSKRDTECIQNLLNLKRSSNWGFTLYV